MFVSIFAGIDVLKLLIMPLGRPNARVCRAPARNPTKQVTWKAVDAPEHLFSPDSLLETCYVSGEVVLAGGLLLNARSSTHHGHTEASERNKNS